MQIPDIDQAVDAVGRVYCPHRVIVTAPARNIVTELTVAQPTTQPMVTLSYSAPVRIDAGDFPRLFLMMHCARGSARTRQGNRQAHWGRGQTMPFSAGHATQLWFDEGFVQQGVRLDLDRMEALCAQWLGHPLSQQLRFDLSPFSAQLERTWQATLTYMWSFDESGIPLEGVARRALDELLLSLLLHRHPHNYIAEMATSAPTPVPGVVRRAERFMQEHVDRPITVTDVAAQLGVSVRTLQQGFRQWRSTTPTLYLRDLRLRRVREQLLGKGSPASVSEVALQYGFTHLGRFSADYRRTFGEAPSITLRRSR